MRELPALLGTIQEALDSLRRIAEALENLASLELEKRNILK